MVGKVTRKSGFELLNRQNKSGRVKNSENNLAFVKFKFGKNLS